MDQLCSAIKNSNLKIRKGATIDKESRAKEYKTILKRLFCMQVSVVALVLFTIFLHFSAISQEKAEDERCEREKCDTGFEHMGSFLTNAFSWIVAFFAFFVFVWHLLKYSQICKFNDEKNIENILESRSQCLNYTLSNLNKYLAGKGCYAYVGSSGFNFYLVNLPGGNGGI
jgi:hypothetical protein